MRIKTIGAIIALSLLFSLSNVVSAQLVKVEINNSTDYESFTLLDPNNGNWIEMVGGESKIELPDIKFIYNGTDSTHYTTDGKTVNITTHGIEENQLYVVDYPFDGISKQPLYYESDPVKAKLYTNDNLIGEEVYVYLINTYPTKLKDVFTSAVDGETQPLKNMLDNAIEEKPITINQNKLNDLNLNFGELPPGDYVIVATLKSPSKQNITFLSATCFEVLEHKSAIKELKKRDSGFKQLSGIFTIQDGSDQANYTYIAAMMKEDSPINFTLESRGTKESTNIYANDAELVDSWSISGSDLNNINASTVFEWFNGTFPPNSVSIEKYPKTGNSHDFGLPIQGLTQGSFQLNIGAWNATNSSQKLIAFSQKIVSFLGPGGSLVRYEPPDVIYMELEENNPSRVEINNFSPQKSLRFEINNSAFTSINITAKENVSNFKVNVTKDSDDLSISGGVKVYQSMGIEVNPEGKVENTVITFKVDQSWLNQNDLSRNDIILQRFHQGSWQSLSTQYKTKENGKLVYETAFTGFSLFAITSKPATDTTVLTGGSTGGGRIVDSDGDGYSDGYENKHGTDPNDPDDYPGKPLPATTTAAAQPSPTVTATTTATTEPTSPSPTPSSALTETPAETPEVENGAPAWQPMEIVVIAAVLIGSAAVIIYIVRR